MKRATVTIGLLFAACRGDPTVPNLEYIPEMIDSVAYDSFARNPVTPDGKTLLAPPEGTIPRGLKPLHYGPGKEEAVRAGRELVNPVPWSEGARKRGAEVYANFCAVCHGREGQGDGPVIGRFPAPPSLLGERARRMPDGEMFHIVTMGQGLMKPYAVQVRRQDRWKVIHYVRSLQAEGGTK
jgi:mono/diheme cytochrome c family protein